jgi:hypothetical protein
VTRLCFLSLLLTLAPQALAVQDPPPVEDPPAKKLEAWPALPDEKLAKKDVARLRAGRTEAMAEEAHAALVAEGAGVAPLLLDALAHERDEDALERIDAVLLAVTGAEHTRLCAEFLDDKDVAVRRWVLRRMAGFPDAGLRARAAGHFARVQGTKRNQDAEELYLAALFCASTGSSDGIDILFAAAEKSWGKLGAELRAALEGVRGPVATELLLMGLHEEQRQAKVTALRLLAGAGTKKALAHVSVYLDSTDNSLRVEAINACRGIVDGDLPIDKLSVFEAVELAKQWKSRL